MCVCAQVISAALSLLTPEKANLMLLSPEHEGQCPLREKWFGTQYSVEGASPRRLCVSVLLWHCTAAAAAQPFSECIVSFPLRC